MDKKIKDTKVGKWIAEKLPDVASKVGDFLPDSGVLGIIKRVVDNEPSLTHDQKVEFEKLMIEEEMGAQEQVTRRWEADARGDVKLAKYIRPVTLVVLTFFYMGLTVWDGLSLQFTPPESYISLLEILMLTVFGAYFAGRTIEKVKK
ncbi:MAG: hypothetical protein P8J32_05820 [bacterium]|mgnify:CR=1 FL=1|nr:hypothetical protein [bacterium]